MLYYLKLYMLIFLIKESYPKVTFAPKPPKKKKVTELQATFISYVQKSWIKCTAKEQYSTPSTIYLLCKWTIQHEMIIAFHSKQAYNQ